MANVISQSILSGEVNANKKTLSGELTPNQKILSGNFVERIVTNAKWGKISGDIETQEDLMTLLERYENVVTNIVEEPNGQDITIYWIDQNGYEHNMTVPLSYVLDRIRYIYNNGLVQEIVRIFEDKEWYALPVPGSSINVQLPELVFWVNNGTLDGKLIKLLTAEGTGVAINALKTYIFEHYTSTSDLAPVAISGSYNDLSDKPTEYINIQAAVDPPDPAAVVPIYQNFRITSGQTKEEIFDAAYRHEMMRIFVDGMDEGRSRVFYLECAHNSQNSGTVTFTDSMGTRIKLQKITTPIQFFGWSVIARTNLASDVLYENQASGLDATNVQTAIDEVASNLDEVSTDLYSIFDGDMILDCGTSTINV